MKLTVFESIFDKKTDKTVEFEDFQGFEKLLYKLSKLEARKPKKGDGYHPKNAKLISPAVYKKDTGRGNDNVLRWDFACLDVDDYDGTFEQIVEHLGDWYYVCYSTASSTAEKPKFRLVFPLTKPVQRDNIRHFWQALNKEVLGIADAQTKDMARMFYVPGDYPGAFNFFFKHEGEVIDPAKLMEKHPYDASQDGDDFFNRLPEEMQKMVLEHRRAKTEKKSHVSWTSYRDCKYVFKKAVDEYISAVAVDTGKYHGMYRFMVAVAFAAIRDGYDIDKHELASLARSLDIDYGNHYENRPLQKEADRAIHYAYCNIGLH